LQATAAPRRFDELYGLSRRIEVSDDDMRAVLRQSLRECLADAAGRAGDDRDLIQVALAHVPFPALAMSNERTGIITASPRPGRGFGALLRIRSA
jgi:hypothetical protein